MSPRGSPRVTTKKEAKTRKAAVKAAATAGDSSGRVSPSVGKNSRSGSPAVANRTAQSKTNSPNISMPKLEKVSDKLSLKVNQTSGTSRKSATAPPQQTGDASTARSNKVNLSKKNSTLGSLSPSVQPNSTKLEDDNSSAATVKLRVASPAATDSPSLQSKTSFSINSINKDNSLTSLSPQIIPKPRTESSKPSLKSVKSIFDDDSSDEDDYDAKTSDAVNSFSLASPTSDHPEIDSDDNSATDPLTLPGNNGSESHVPETTSATESMKSASKITETLEDDDDEDVEEVIIRKPVTQNDISRLHNDRWEGVNGCYDNEGQWLDWTQCLSVLFNEEEHPLHILPYVSLD